MKKPLGRGLDALLEGLHELEASEPHTPLKTNLLALTHLSPSRLQPRQHFDDASLAQLAASIAAQGVLQPIIVREIGAQEYEIIAGERRARAARLAGLQEIPAIIRPLSDETALAIALIENLQREDLNPLEEAQGIQRLIDDFSLTHARAADMLGCSRSAVSNLLRLLELHPQVQALIHDGSLDMGHARALLSLDGARQIQAAQQIVAQQLSVRSAEKLAQRLAHPPAPTTHKTSQNPDERHLSTRLTEQFGAEVTLKSHTNGGGKIVIAYHSLNQLDELLARWGIAEEQ